MDLKEIARDLDLEEDEYLELLELFLETSASDLVRLETAIAERDGDKVKAAAHSIKGAAGTLGLKEIFEIAKRTEFNARENNLKDSFEAVMAMREKLDQIATELAGR